MRPAGRWWWSSTADKAAAWARFCLVLRRSTAAGKVREANLCDGQSGLLTRRNVRRFHPMVLGDVLQHEMCNEIGSVSTPGSTQPRS